MQFTRFLRNEAVSVAEMAAHAAKGTAQRVAGREIVAIQDTSDLVLGGRRARAKGFGPVGRGGALGGLVLHPVLALDAASGALLGLVDVTIWNRDAGQAPPRRSRATAQKESQRWIEGTRRAGEVLAGASRITMVEDQEGDFYEQFARRPASVDLIVRACQELPGQRLFQYQDGEVLREVTSADVNAYLREITGSDITAKDFRTWAGTVMAATLSSCRSHRRPRIAVSRLCV